jgi:hypothetical protein
MTMGGQKYIPPIDKDKEAVDQQKSAAEKSDRAWRTQTMLASVTPGSGSGRVIDWRSFGR